MADPSEIEQLETEQLNASSDQSDTNSFQANSTTFIQRLNRWSQNPIYSNLLKLISSFILLLSAFVSANYNDKKVDENGELFNLTHPIDSYNLTHLANFKNSAAYERSFGFHDFYFWYAVALVFSNFIYHLIYLPYVMTLTAGILFVGNSVFRMMLRHFLVKNNMFDYLFRVSQIMSLIIAPTIRALDDVGQAKPISTPYLAPTNLIYMATTLASYIFNAAFLYLTQDNTSLLFDSLHIFVLIIHSKRILKLNGLITYFSYKNVNQQQNDETNEIVFLRPKNEQENPLDYWSEITITIIGFYVKLIAVFWSPKDDIRLVFIGLISHKECHSTALLALVYGVNIFLGTLVVGFLHIKRWVPRLSIIIFAFVGHYIMFVVVYFNYDELTFQALAMSQDKYWLSILLTTFNAYFTAILFYHETFYLFSFRANHKKMFDILIRLFHKLLVIPLFYFKLNSKKPEQMSTFTVTALMAFAAFYYYEEIVKDRYFVENPNRRFGQVRLGENQGMDVAEGGARIWAPRRN